MDLQDYWLNPIGDLKPLFCFMSYALIRLDWNLEAKNQYPCTILDVPSPQSLFLLVAQEDGYISMVKNGLRKQELL